MELLWRFLIGGAVVSTLALLADVVRPKRLAELFGAAHPSSGYGHAGAGAWEGEVPEVKIEARSMGRRGRKAAVERRQSKGRGRDWALACFALVMQLVAWQPPRGSCRPQR